MNLLQPKWEDLGIANDFLFGKVMQNPRLCKQRLQRILTSIQEQYHLSPETGKKYL